MPGFETPGPAVAEAGAPVEDTAFRDDEVEEQELVSATATLDDPTLGRGSAFDAFSALGFWADEDVPSLLKSPVIAAQAAPTSSSSQPPQQQPRQSPMPQGPTTDPKVVAKAVKDKKTRDQIGIDWIGSPKMDRRIVDSIDTDFADGKTSAKARKRLARSGEMKRINSDREKALAAKRTAIMKQKNVTAATAKQDPDYKALVELWDRAREAVVIGEQVDVEESMDRGNPKKTLTTPETEKITAEHGRVKTRNNFMGWARGVFKDDSQIQPHYESIQPVTKGSDMLLAGTAAKRYLAAVAQFEKEHPGYTIFQSGSSSEMRHRHEMDQGAGKLGHPLGLAFDLKAGDNPNINDDRDRYDLNQWMLEKFGAENPADPQSIGRATMDRKRERDGKQSMEKRVETLGKHTFNEGRLGGETTQDDEDTVTQIKDEFSEMVRTSDRFQKSLPAENVDQLKNTRSDYFTLRKKEEELRRKPKDEALLEEVTSMREDIKKKLDIALTPWTDRLHEENAGWLDAEKDRLDAANAAHESSVELKELADDELDTFAADLGLESKESYDAKVAANNKRKGKGRKKLPTYKQTLSNELSAREKAARADAQSERDKINVNEALEKKLMSPERMFGGKRNDNGDYEVEIQAGNVPVMQLIEHGFVRNDEMKEMTDEEFRQSKAGRKGIFNGEAVAMLARYGLSPGATFGDTMHFDFIEGYNELIEGGRWGGGTFGPDGYHPKQK